MRTIPTFVDIVYRAHKTCPPPHTDDEHYRRGDACSAR